jgi:hypothetical protein
MSENDETTLFTFLNDTEKESFLSKGEFPLPTEGISSLPPFLIELVSGMKKTVTSIKAIAEFSKGRFKDERFGEYFNKRMAEDTEKLDTVLQGLLDYVKVNTPIPKADTVRKIIEDVLGMERKRMEGKRIRVFKKFEKGLPETTLHDEQLKYVIHSILQYAFPLILEDGNLGVLTRSVDVSKRKLMRGDLPQENEKYIEILILFAGCKKPAEPIEVALGIPGIPKDDVGDLILRLVREIVQKNCGEMKFEFREKESRTLITLRLPTERRKIFSYYSGKA